MANRSAAGFGKVMSVTSATFLSTGTRAYASCGRYRSGKSTLTFQLCEIV